MKIKDYIELTGMFNAFTLDHYPDSKQIQKFDEWLLENEWALPHAHLGHYYEPALIGDILHPAIMIAKDCPPRALTMIRIRWS